MYPILNIFIYTIKYVQFNPPLLIYREPRDLEREQKP